MSAWVSIKFKGNRYAVGHNLGNQHAAGHVPWNKGRVGQPAWNKGLKGIHLSPKTEFKPGITPATKAPVGSIKIRTRKWDGKQRAWVKVAEPNVWRLRAVVAWEHQHGPVPRGLLIHHKDRNTLNDDLDNLSAISRAEHLKEHRSEFERKRLVGLRSQTRAK
jgi:hypothetical protein